VSYAIILKRGKCAFNEKVKAAQDANFSAAIVFDDRRDGSLIYMNGPDIDITIPSVFVSYSTNLALGKREDSILITPDEYPQWPQYFTTMAASAACGVLLFAMFVVYRRQRGLRVFRRGERQPLMSRRQAMQLPSRRYTAADEGEQCCICLEPYARKHVLTVLPCKHIFHKKCIEPWLMERDRVCPICKRDPMATETTPLLSSEDAVPDVGVESDDSAADESAAEREVAATATVAAYEQSGSNDDIDIESSRDSDTLLD
jgi:hypothetical protein